MGGQNVKNTMLDVVVGLLAPHLCSNCGRSGSVLCVDCKKDIISQPFLGCVLCGQSARVGICDNHRTPYSPAWIVGERKSALQRAIGNYKFQNMKAAARDLAELLSGRLPDLPAETVLVPIPTASSHMRERGYDHALLLARYLGMIRRLPVQQLLGRQHSATQHHSNRQQRLEQAASAFMLKDSVNPRAHYLLIDDVVTTGSTLAAAATLLRTAGARHVAVAALARQPLD